MQNGKVYAVCVERYPGQNVVGIFSSREKAAAFIAEGKHILLDNTATIGEWAIDVPWQDKGDYVLPRKCPDCGYQNHIESKASEDELAASHETYRCWRCNTVHLVAA